MGMREKTLRTSRRLRPLMAILAAATTLPAPAAPPQCPGPESTLSQRYRAGTHCWPPMKVAAGVEARELGPLPPPRYPPENPYNAAKERLGKALFFDPRLSASGQLACASCHDPDLAWGDGRRVSFGHARQAGRRNAPTLLNVFHRNLHFWDGRARSLEDQALASLTDPIEMAADARRAAARVAASPAYRRAFKEAFGEARIDARQITRAIATFVRGIQSRPNRLDRFMAGERDALTDQEILGLHLFRTRAGCMNCHHGPLMSDGRFHNIGLHYYRRKFEDLGRYEVTGRPQDMGAFLTPGLRDTVFQGPWMHNGLFASLGGILRMYNAGGAHPAPRPSRSGEPPYPRTSTLLRPLHLSASELAALEAFLHAVSRRPARVLPPQVAIIPACEDSPDYSTALPPSSNRPFNARSASRPHQSSETRPTPGAAHSRN